MAHQTHTDTHRCTLNGRRKPTHPTRARQGHAYTAELRGRYISNGGGGARANQNIGGAWYPRGCPTRAAAECTLGHFTPGRLCESWLDKEIMRVDRQQVESTPNLSTLSRFTQSTSAPPPQTCNAAPRQAYGSGRREDKTQGSQAPRRSEGVLTYPSFGCMALCGENGDGRQQFALDF